MSPRDGSNIYSQPDPNVVADTTIESAKYNNFTNDIAQDLNLPRPIVAGGTGATNAHDARVALGAEVASTGQVVTNYDSQVWESGSFVSFSGATNAPQPAEHFSGNSTLLTGDQSYITIRAISFQTGATYTRIKAAGVWGGWTTSDNLAGDLTVNGGDITINSVGTSKLTINKAASGQSNSIVGTTAGIARWFVQIGDTATESGSNAGSNFNIASYSDAGASIGTPFAILRATGNAQFSNNLTIGGSGTTGTLLFGNTGTKTLVYDGSNYILSGGDFYVNGKGNFSDAVQSSYGYQCRSGTGGGFGANHFNLFWAGGGNVQMWIDATNFGVVAYTSDYRTKKDITDLPRMWNTVKELRPVRYTQKAYKELFAADNVERWGFVAHELQNTLTPSAATGVKDSSDTVQSPNPFTLIAALTKALQEAMARIEKLEVHADG